MRFFSRYELEKAIQKYRYALIRLDTLKKFKSAFSCNLNIRHEIKAPQKIYFAVVRLYNHMMEMQIFYSRIVRNIKEVKAELLA